jgi:hypothetical protein
MGISMNPKMSGFRRWAEIHEPGKIDKAPTGTDEGGVIGAMDGDQGAKPPDQQLHRLLSAAMGNGTVGAERLLPEIGART